jgi:putative membrane protein
MGIADLIPGISGGSIAFISGIYERWLHAICSVDSDAGRFLIRKDFTAFWEKIDGNFLSTVVAGILTSLVIMSNLMQYLLKNYSIMTWSFFFGLILMAAPLMVRKIKIWNKLAVFAFVTGMGVMYFLTTLPPLKVSDSIIIIFFSGIISVWGLVLPGISGVSILMLTGSYQFVVTALNETNMIVIGAFAFGSITGIIGAVRILTWSLSKNHHVTLALLTGFMVGALNKIWPWRNVLEYATNVKGDQIAVFDKSVLPWHFLSVTGKDPQLFQAILMMALGVLIVVVTEKVAIRLKTKH